MPCSDLLFVVRVIGPSDSELAFALIDSGTEYTLTMRWVAQKHRCRGRHRPADSTWHGWRDVAGRRRERSTEIGPPASRFPTLNPPLRSVTERINSPAPLAPARQREFEPLRRGVGRRL